MKKGGPIFKIRKNKNLGLNKNKTISLQKNYFFSFWQYQKNFSKNFFKKKKPLSPLLVFFLVPQKPKFCFHFNSRLTTTNNKKNKTGKKKGGPFVFKKFRGLKGREPPVKVQQPGISPKPRKKGV